MTKCHPPTIENSDSEDYTKITFSPDLGRFKIKSLSKTDTLKLMERRIHDVAGIHGSSLKVTYNSKPIQYSNLRDYFELYKTDDSPLVFQKVNNRWSVGVCTSSTQLNVSFVNSIATSRGGTHVSYILDQVSKGIEKNLSRKDKKFKGITLNQIKVSEYYF